MAKLFLPPRVLLAKLGTQLPGWFISGQVSGRQRKVEEGDEEMKGKDKGIDK